MKLKFNFIVALFTFITLIFPNCANGAENTKWCLVFNTFEEAPSITVCGISDRTKKLYEDYDQETSYKAKREKFIKLFYSTYKKNAVPDENVFGGLLAIDLTKAAIKYDEPKNIERLFTIGYSILINSKDEEIKKVGYRALISIFIMDKALGYQTIVPCGEIAKKIVEEYPETEKYYPEDYKKVKAEYLKWNYGSKK